MGTRSGDIDPAVLEFLLLKEGMSMSEISTLLNKQSGLLGLSGLTNDMRDLLDEAENHQDRRAMLAINIFAQRAKKYLGAYLAELNGADASFSREALVRIPQLSGSAFVPISNG